MIWFSVGLLRAVLPSRPLLRAPLPLESHWRRPGQHARCGEIIIMLIVSTKIKRLLLQRVSEEIEIHSIQRKLCNVINVYQDMYGPSMVINKDERSDRIKTIIKYFKEMRGRWEIQQTITSKTNSATYRLVYIVNKLRRGKGQRGLKMKIRNLSNNWQNINYHWQCWQYGEHLTTIETTHDFSHFMYMMKFVACETLNLVNVLGQMYFMDRWPTISGSIVDRL